MLLRSASTPILKSSSSTLRVESDPSIIRIKHNRSFISVAAAASSPSTSLTKTTSDGNLKRLLQVSKPQGRSELVLENGHGGGCGGSGYGGGYGGGDGYGDWDKGSESMDLYYQKMIRAYPDDPLVLSNYAKYLKEVKFESKFNLCENVLCVSLGLILQVRGDVEKAEEYCERAILMNPDEGNVLSLYGDLIWCNHKDANRAQTYFDQAVKSAPDDS